MIGILTWFLEADNGELVTDHTIEVVRCRDCRYFHKTAPHRYRPDTVRLHEFVEANKPHMTWNELYDAVTAEGFRYKNADSLRHSYIQICERHLKYRCSRFGTNDLDGFCAWGERKVEG